MAVEGVHAVLDDFISQIFVLRWDHSFDIWHCAEAHEQISHALGEVQVVEERLHEVFLGDYELQELLGLFDQPERQDFV
eukprot:CAMPEP_0170458820 /NCGR_PEP_ID=MMETSP0123-20130129/5679_1 /TAXON_ID=182087 /ORGANISM="Favella ehrenbergii, Strain Fehren 1" /LENGTH=78 /DNA_ID=CAMNT_0010723129 /DNA_START=1199 /DNA_END=1435 /DNA_ORIENTATION=+